MIKVSVVLILCLFLSSAYGQSCNALCLQGSTDQGAWQAGAIIGLIQNAQSGEAAYDVITGVGIGSLNAGIFSQYPKGQETAAASQLQNVWTNMKASNWYKNWLAGPVQGLLVEAGMYNTKPAISFLQSVIPGSPQRYVQVGACDADEVEYIVFNNFDSTLSVDQLRTGILGSYATAGIFPYVVNNGETLIDGASMKNIDIAGAVEQCKQLGFADSNINVDIVLFDGTQWANVNVTGYNTLKMLFLALKLTNYRGTLFDIQKADWDYPDVNFRYLVTPQATLPTSSVPLGFSQAENQAMISQGISDAQYAISIGPTAGWNEFTSTATGYLTSTFGTEATIDNSAEHQQMVANLKAAFAEEAAQALFAKTQ